MITFLPGQIAAAADVNANFTELATAITNLTAINGAGAILTLSNAQSIPSGLVDTQIAFNTTAYDSGHGFVSGTTIKVPAGQAGLYIVSTSVQFSDTATTGRRELHLVKSAIAVARAIGPSSDYWGASLIRPMVLAAGDILKAEASHNGGASLPLWAGDGVCHLAAIRIA